MNGRAFKLGTFARPNGKPFAAIVLDTAIDLAQAHEAYRASGRPALSSTSSIQDLLDDWERNFATLQEIVAFLEGSQLMWLLDPEVDLVGLCRSYIDGVVTRIAVGAESGSAAGSSVSGSSVSGSSVSGSSASGSSASGSPEPESSAATGRVKTKREPSP